MSSQGSRLQSRWRATRSLPPLLTLLLLVSPALALSQDGVLLLKFKSSILSDPFAVLRDWNYYDATPCSWNGVVCMGFPDAAALTWRTPPPPPPPPTAANTAGGGDVQVPMVSRVINLVLPNSRLLGSVPPELGLLEHLRHLDLSGNMLNGTLPPSLFNASELRLLSLANNAISGELPELDGRMSSSLQVLNLSDNALIGRLPANLSRLPNLTVVSLANNYLYGQLAGGGFERLQYLDLSSNLVNGSLPTDFGGPRLRYLNLSYNRLTGAIPLELGTTIPANATVDLSFNNLTGEIPQGGAFAGEKPMAFVGNPSLCGRPLRTRCAIPSIPSTVSDHPNSSTAAPQKRKSPPAFAAIPKNTDGTSPAGGGQSSAGRGTLRPLAVIAITVGDLAGIAILFVVFLYLYHVKKKKTQEQQQQTEVGGVGLKNEPPSTATTASSESKTIGPLSCCLRKKGGGDGGDTEETSETSGSSETEGEVEEAPKGEKEGEDGRSHSQQKLQGATLVMVDGETELEIDTLLKASAYILGASASSIVYKAVLADGTALAVRRIGEGSVIGKLKDFGAQVRSIVKFRHPNLLRLRGFSWGADEKLLIHDYAPNGSLANISLSKKLGSSPLHLSWEARLRIARGVARGLAYIHEKKCFHGNLKPSNILLDSDMEPKIGDFGLDRVMFSAGASARQFGSKRSMHSSISLPDLSSIAGASPSAAGCSSSASALAPPPYQAPESLKNLKPGAKWDVYSFGMVLLELVAGRVFSEVELCHWNAGLVVEERNRLLRMADAAIRGEVEGKEEALLCCFKLGFACCAMAPQRRPSMKDAVQVLDNISSLPHPQSANVLLSNHSKWNP
ncbi:hypothetical protein OPV22_018543 [Ensete ventricosum]|uniref:Protein kinase domain-containing protein n=1 Tax=Ensete ventricosum TaxID=4639 RepID=A0AAV8QZR1_ENSVE|nr:hypothetical protein OPV22_018543 [Ensete ventricosum]